MLKKQPSYGIGVVAYWGVAVNGLGGSTYNVVLDKLTCTCNVYDTLQVPCSHALAAALHICVSLNTTAGEWYNMSVWKKDYAGDLLPILGPSDINIGDNFTSVKKIPPVTHQQSGKRQKVRIPSTSDFSGQSNAKSLRALTSAVATAKQRITVQLASLESPKIVASYLAPNKGMPPTSTVEVTS
ncbi:unnamed protein product [Arabis nemorensis]|uniref:SWIM-type domain-containing protein n=1 Tax=Arabis nemorensis TaxID=586526 RepID=A0A565CMU2_9BRAS|nr:unnamed protein product [Arabis nemorensis]